MTKKLLIKLRDQIKDKPILMSGLCYEVIKLCIYSSSPITEDEYSSLTKYIHQHRPKWGKHFCEDYCNNAWYWPEHEVKPRLDWLNYRIKYYGIWWPFKS